jgi:peptidoglycan hydrolase-like amidase
LYQAAQIARESFKWKLSKANKQISKITKKYTINDVQNLVNQNISVLLYELSADYDSFQVVCDEKCIFNIDGVNYNREWATLTFLTNKIQVSSDRNLSANSVSVKSSMKNWAVTISNYNRKSYVWIPWNSFKWSLNFEKWTYPLKNGNQKSDFIVINTLPFSEYMKWIVETNDTETLEKNKVMAMIAKNYALFYLNWDNIHPSILEAANYQAIDDPDFFQKYVWAWLEKTLTKRYQALESTKNQVVMFDWYLPILPYFSCSAWFTLSAEEKRWWNDTPYLKSIYDFNTCDDFVWHWVGLAWRWAERFAQQGMTYDQILKYYYDGIDVVKIQ